VVVGRLILDAVQTPELLPVSPAEPENRYPFLDRGVISDRGSGTFESSVRWNAISTQKEMTMDWNRVEGNWKQLKGAAKEKWGKLTDDDLNIIEGRREQLEGKLQQRYGFAKDQIHRDVDDWFRTLK
jgi:uncharacterized protein YjbJ (UPF0337 family)